MNNDEYSDTLAPTEKAAIPPGIVHRFINTYDDRNSVVVGEFPYDVMVSENNISGKKEELKISIDRRPIEESPKIQEDLDQPTQNQQPHPAAVESESAPVPQPKKKTRTPPQK